jgi:ribosomal protein S18 acetylase RimI-like enzyme
MTNECVEIITLPPDQWQAYRDLRLRALREDPQAFGASYAATLQLPEAHWRLRLHEAATTYTNWLLFALQNGAMVGMMGAYINPDEAPDAANIVAVFVAPEARGQGIGRLLMNILLDSLRENPMLSMARLAVNKEQTAALKLYQGTGFAVVRETQCRMGHGEIADEWLMEKNLRL